MAILVVIAAWKTSDFALAVAPQASDLALRLVVGLLYFVVFMASEIWPHAVRPIVVRMTRAILFGLLIAVILAQSLDSTYAVITEGMEYERLQKIRQTIEAFTLAQLDRLNGAYEKLLAESGCAGGRTKKSRAVSVVCQTLQHNREEVINVPRTYRIDPTNSRELREQLKAQLDEVDLLRKKLPSDHRKFEVYPIFNLGPEMYSYVLAAGWAVRNYTRLPAQMLFGHLARSVMILVLTIVAGLWCQVRPG